MQTKAEMMDEALQINFRQGQKSARYPSSQSMNAGFGFPLDIRRYVQVTQFPDNTYRHHPEPLEQELSWGEVGTKIVKSMGAARSKKSFVPDAKKDNVYWEKRMKNNTAAKRSRAKRKMVEMSMQIKFIKLQEENLSLKRELVKLKSCIPDLKGSHVMKCIRDENLSPGKFRYGDDLLAGPDTSQSCTNNPGNDHHFSSIGEDSSLNRVFDLCQYFPLNLSPTITLIPELSHSPPIPPSVDGYKMKKVPHKFRLKLTSHSAFSQ